MQINRAGPPGSYAALITPMEGIMTGEEAIVFGLIVAAFVIFGTTLAWLSHK